MNQSASGFTMKRIIKQLASLKLAVVVILALGAITAWGTFVEAQYNSAQVAQKMVYHSPWMYSAMGMLCISLIAVMVDRWPWKVRHTGFVLAHIGIITILAGALITRYYGIDGSIVLRPGEANKYVVVGETDLTVYSSMDGSSFAKIADQEVDFFRDRPTAERPKKIEVPDGAIEIVDYMPFSVRDQKIVESQSASDGSAVRFQLQNANVNMTEWIMQAGQEREAVKNLGPAQIILTRGQYTATGQNAIVLKPQPDGESLEYTIHSRRSPASEASGVKRGIAKAGDVIETPWMGMVMRVLKYLPKAKEEIKFFPRDSQSDMTEQAIKVRFNGEERWTAANTILKLFAIDKVYIVTFANRRIDLARAMDDSNFSVSLRNFEVGRYQGTARAASYQSLVDVPGIGETLISMNEPLKHKGFTFYQASFNQDESGRPTESILSVNRDPGRWIKYLGALMIVLGTIHLFYFKKMAAQRAKSASVGDA